MAISRHKVLSEMQQQLEMASSKCGSLQKQLEIVKNKVRQSSTTNLLSLEPLENKENKVKADNSSITLEADRESEYEKALSISSSSTEDVNEERDVNIIKVFYDRLGRMDYPKGQVELSDISSEENGLNVDQILSTMNYSVSKKETRKNGRKEKRNNKKAKARMNETSAILPKRITPKGKNIPAILSPYKSLFMKPVKQMPTKTVKNLKNHQIPVKTGSDSRSNLLNQGITRPQQGPASKIGAKKLRRKAQNAYVGLPTKNAKKEFQEPIQRVNSLANELRKTKSSTVAERKDKFCDTRSLTRIIARAIPEVVTTHEPVVTMSKKQSLSKDLFDRDEVARKSSKEKIKIVDTPKPLSAVHHNLNRMDLRTTKNHSAKNKKEEEPAQKKPIQIKSAQDKNTWSGQASSSTDLIKKTDLPAVSRIKDSGFKKGSDVTLTETVKTPRRECRDKNSEVKTTTHKSMYEQRNPPWNSRTRLRVRKDEKKAQPEETRNVNGLFSQQAVSDSKENLKVKQRVDMLEKIPNSKVIHDTELDSKIGMEKNNFSVARKDMLGVTQTNSSICEGNFRKGPLSIVSSLPHVPQLYKENEMADLGPVTVSQIKKIKDNVMKFNSIPFIVGQSTTKSYHIGLNLQETYSLFKQTPSMTALMVSKFVDNGHHLNGRSTRTGYSGRSTSSVKQRESCPACDPVPEPSTEQRADPWAVPQDEAPVVRVCTCLPRRMVSFDQVLNQLYFTNMNIVNLHPSFLPNKGCTNEDNAVIDGKNKTSLQNKPTNAYYTKLLRSIQSLKDNMMG